MFRPRKPRRRARDPVIGKIDGVRRALVAWGLGWGWLCAVLFVAVLIFAGVLLDHAFVLQRWGRLAFLRAFAFSALGAALVATLWPFLRRTNRLYIARRMEAERPELKNALISYLEVRDDPHTPHEIKRLIRRKAQRSIRGLDSHVAVDGRRYVRLASVLGAVVVSFALYSIFSPKSTAVSMERLLRPGADILPPTATRLEMIVPGDLYVITGDEPEVSVQVTGQRPAGAQVVWDGQTFTDRRVLLDERRPGTWEGRFPPILEDGTYYVQAGDTRSEVFDIRALPKPVVTRLRLHVKPPAYTGLGPQVLTDGSADVVKGTELELTAWTSLPPGSGRLEFDAGRRQWMEALPGEQALRGRFTARRTDSYVIRFESVQYPNGAVFENRSPLKYTIFCREDEPPLVRLQAPPDRTEVGPRETVTVRYEAQDDFELEAVRLCYRMRGISKVPITIAEPAARVLQDASYEWDMATVAATPGTQVTYYLEAEDNRPDVVQVGRSAERTLVIGRRDAEPGPALPGDEAERREDPAEETSDGDREPEGERAATEAEEQEPAEPPDRDDAQPEAELPQDRETAEEAPEDARAEEAEPTEDPQALREFAERIDRAIREAEDEAIPPGGDEPARGEGEEAAADPRGDRAADVPGEGPALPQEAPGEQRPAPGEDGQTQTGGDQVETAGGGQDGQAATEPGDRAGRMDEPGREAEGGDQSPEGEVRRGGEAPGAERGGSDGGAQDAEAGAQEEDGSPRPATSGDSSPGEQARSGGGETPTQGAGDPGDEPGDFSGDSDEEPSDSAGGQTGSSSSTRPGSSGSGGTSGAPSEGPGSGSHGSGQAAGPAEQEQASSDRNRDGEASPGSGSGSRPGEGGGESQEQGDAAGESAGGEATGAGRQGSAGETDQTASGQGTQGSGDGSASAGRPGEGPAAGTDGGADGAPGGQQAGSSSGSAAATSGTSGAPGTPGSATGGDGSGVLSIPRGGGSDNLPNWRDADAAVEELANMLDQDSLPPDMLEKLGTDRDALTEFVERYRRERERMEEQDRSERAEAPARKGRVAGVAGPAAEDVAAGDGLPAETEKDVLRSRFEGASDRLSPRYREVVDRYYKQLSRE